MTNQTQVQHTPGPWQHNGLEQPAASAGLDPADWLPVAVYAGDTPICTTYLGERFSRVAPPVEERAANARLLASAPDLLAALETLVAMDNCNYERDTMRYEGAFDRAREAIARARGED